MRIALVILAAGQGTRMNSDLPKVLHQVAQAPMLALAMRAGAGLDPERIVVIAGHGADLVAAAAHDFDDRAEVVLQAEQLGTAHAVDQARAALAQTLADHGICSRAVADQIAKACEEVTVEEVHP